MVGVNPSGLNESECYLMRDHEEDEEPENPHHSHAFFDAEEGSWWWCMGTEP